MPRSVVDRRAEIALSIAKILYSAAYALHCSIVGIFALSAGAVVQPLWANLLGSA
jgi:hypothetical protein